MVSRTHDLNMVTTKRPRPKMIEIERRFLCEVADPRVLDTAPASNLRQGYLTAEGPTVRVRKIADRYLMTIKVGTGIVRREVEFQIPTEAGRELLEITDELMIEKRRYYLGRWEIDIFKGDLEGLTIAEVELAATDEPLPDLPPGIILGREVTDDPRFTNQSLASLGPDSLTDLLNELGPDDDGSP